MSELKGIFNFLKRGRSTTPRPPLKGGEGSGGRGDEPMYGEGSVKENVIPKILNKYKDPSSKKRVMRDMYGVDQTGPIDAEEQAAIDNVMNANTYQPDKFADSNYASELMGDVSQMMNQTQPVDVNDPDMGVNGINRVNAIRTALEQFKSLPLEEQDRIRTIGLNKGLYGNSMDLLPPEKIADNLIKTTGFLGPNIKREAGLSYTPETGYKSYLGTGFNMKDYIGEGDVGSVDINPTDHWQDRLKGFNVHSHPGQPGEPLEPSMPDREFSSSWTNSFVTDDKGNVVKYDDDPQGREDFRVSTPATMNMVLKRIKKRAGK